MKILKSILFFGLLLSTSVPCKAQTDAKAATDSVRFTEYLPVIHTDATKWITRYQTDIDRYQSKNLKLQDVSCDVLFIGSSSINMWDNIYQDMHPLKIIRRSYGGAAIRDMIYNYNTIARSYRPKSIVLYVENDLAGSREDITVGKTFDFFRIFINRLKRDYPGVPVFILSFKPSPARIKMLPKQKTMNFLLEEYAEKEDQVFYVDVTSCMYNWEGEIRTDIFRDDNLHLNQTGYDLWTAILKPRLLKAVH